MWTSLTSSFESMVYLLDQVRLKFSARRLISLFVEEADKSEREEEEEWTEDDI